MTDSCVVSLRGAPFSIVMYGVSSDELAADPSPAVEALGRRGVEAPGTGDLVVASGRRVRVGLPRGWTRGVGRPEHFSHCGRGAR